MKKRTAGPLSRASPFPGHSPLGNERRGGCGITIGWLACRDASLIERLTDAQYFGCVACSRASEVQARMVLRVSDQILADRRQILLQNKALLTTFIEEK